MSRNTDVPFASLSQSHLPSEPRKTLQRILGRLTGPIDQMVDCRSFFFLSPPFIDRHKREYVHYYGMRTMLSREASEAAAELFKEAVATFFSEDYEARGPVRWERLRAFLPVLRHRLEEAAPRFGAKVEDFAEAAAWHVLLDASVSIGTFAITPEGPGERSDYLTLMDYALDFAHTPDDQTEAELARLNAKMRSVTSPYFNFTSNRNYFDGVRIPDDAKSGKIANTIFSTDGYLTWNQYIKVDPDEAHETLRAFVAECIYSIGLYDRDGRPGLETSTGIRIENLRQTHLPLAALGQFRGSVCWLSHTGRHPLKCALIVQKLDDSCQQLLSEHFTYALLESFRVCLSDALNQRDDLTAYYARLAEAFGYLFWSYEVQFIRKRQIVARCREGRVEYPELTSSVQENTDPNADAVSYRPSVNKKGSDVTLRICDLCKDGPDSPIKAHEVVRLLDFDTVVCRAFRINDRGAFEHSKWMIEERFRGVLSTFFATRHRMMSQVVRTIGHQIKHACKPPGSLDLAEALEERLEGSQDPVAIGRDDVYSLIELLRSTDELVGPAEMFRCLDQLSKGIFPREWRRVEKNGQLSCQEILRATAEAIEGTILKIADSFARKVLRMSKDPMEDAPRASFSLRRLEDGAPVALTTLSRINIPRLREDEQYQASLAVMAGLHELSRNAFQATWTNRHQFSNGTRRDMHAWYDVSVDVGTQSVRARLCNVSTFTELTSKSILMLQEIAENLGCIRLIQPKRCETPPGGRSELIYVESIYELLPMRFRFEDDGDEGR